MLPDQSRLLMKPATWRRLRYSSSEKAPEMQSTKLPKSFLISAGISWRAITWTCVIQFIYKSLKDSHQRGSICHPALGHEMHLSILLFFLLREVNSRHSSRWRSRQKQIRSVVLQPVRLWQKQHEVASALLTLHFDVQVQSCPAKSSKSWRCLNRKGLYTSEASSPITVPVGPTWCAARNTSRPPPLPRSRTTSPYVYPFQAFNRLREYHCILVEVLRREQDSHS